MGKSKKALRSKQRQYAHKSIGIGYSITRRAINQNLYGFGLAQIKEEGKAVFDDPLESGLETPYSLNDLHDAQDYIKKCQSRSKI